MISLTFTEKYNCGVFMVDETKEWVSNFKNSYVGVPLSTAKALRPVYIHDEQPLLKNSVVVGKIITNGLKTKDWSCSFKELMETYKWVPPAEVMINLDKTAAWLGFSVRRNTSKGWHTRHMGVRVLLGDTKAWRAVSTAPWDNDLEIPYQVFSGDGFKYHTFSSALDALYKGDRVSCAIAPRFALGHKVGAKVPVVYFQDKIIGFVESNNRVCFDTTFMRYKELFKRKWQVEAKEAKQDEFSVDITKYIVEESGTIQEINQHREIGEVITRTPNVQAAIDFLDARVRNPLPASLHIERPAWTFTTDPNALSYAEIRNNAQAFAGHNGRAPPATSPLAGGAQYRRFAQFSAAANMQAAGFNENETMPPGLTGENLG